MAGKRCANPKCSTPLLAVKGNYCTAGKCKRARSEVVTSKKMKKVVGSSTVTALFAEDDGTQCYEVFAVYGVSRCDISKLNAVMRRNELEKNDEEWSYEVYGRFANSEEDNGYDDTRKVKLSELLKNLDDKCLKKLVKFDKGIENKVEAEKSRILEKLAAEPAEEDEEVEDED